MDSLPYAPCLSVSWLSWYALFSGYCGRYTISNKRETDMENDIKKPGKSRWVSIVVATLISIAFTVGVAWYQISKSEMQAALAEKEREKSVRSTLVAIVEEHIINEKSIELSRLARLIESRRREEGVRKPISVLEIFEKAEFNILNSRYLDFERKQKYKIVFNEQYSKYGAREFEAVKEGPYADLINELAKYVQEGKTSEALEQIKRISDSYQKDIQEIEIRTLKRSELEDVLRRLVERPEFLAIFISVNLILMFVFFPPYRRLMKRFFLRYLNNMGIV